MSIDKPASHSPRVTNRAAVYASAALAVALAACASNTPPPTAEMAAGSSALAQAQGAGAPDLAPGDMRMARDKMDRARLAMNEQRYDTALMLAREAQVDARLAESRANTLKSRKAADELTEASRVLSEELQRKTH